MESASHLLQMLIALLALNGMEPDSADPWRSWMTFKQYVRMVDEVPDPGVSVQILRQADDSTSLVFLRQVLEDSGDRLEPAGGVVMEFNFKVGSSADAEWEIWTFDHVVFERFVDRVEQHIEFTELVVRVPLWSQVYWHEA